jgi:opacity protein-like surface antigen
MAMRKVLEALIVAGALFVSVATARAQDYRFFLMGGGANLFDTRIFTSTAGFQYRSEYVTGGKFTIGLEVPHGKHLGIEGSYAVGHDNLCITGLTINPTEAGYGIWNHRVSLNLVAHARKPILRVQPYATAGVEYDRFTPTRAAVDRVTTQGFTGTTAVLQHDNKMGVNFGGGFEWKVMGPILVRLDVRDHLTGSPTFGLKSQTSGGQKIFSVSGLAQNLEYSAGIVFRFRL